MSARRRHSAHHNGDVVPNDGIYTAAGIFHGFYVLRENDTGPRTIRIAAEVEGRDGLRLATAVDIGTLTVDRVSPSMVTPTATG